VQAHPEISFWRLIGLHTYAFVPAVVLLLTLTVILFAGPLLQLVLDDSGPGDDDKQPLIQTIRNLVVGPLTEELVFRACMCPVLVAGGFSPETTIIFVPFFFGIAHLHHIMQHLHKTGASLNNAIVAVIFQLVYTTLFGMYSAFLFVRTGHIIPAFLAHSFCNYMGFPHFEEVPSHKHKLVLAVTYVAGLVTFCFALPRLTDPEYYDSILYNYSKLRFN